MRVIITGGAGTLGSNIAERLIAEKHEVLIIDNFETGNRDNLQGVNSSSIIEGNVSDYELMDKTFQKFEPTHVIHSAASYKDPDNWIEDANTNVIGSLIIAQLSKKYSVKKLINFQTAIIYGKSEIIPIPVNKEPDPQVSYGISKMLGEIYMQKIFSKLISFRLANICSPRLSIGPIPMFYKRLKSNQPCYCTDAIRDFIDFDDFYDLLMKSLNNNVTGMFNVSTGRGSSITEIFNIVKNKLGLKEIQTKIFPVQKGDLKNTVLDSSKTFQTFDWTPKIKLKEMIEKQIDYYEEFGVVKIFSHIKK